MHPYRPLFVEAAPRAAAPPRDLTVASGVLIAVSAIQLASGAQIVAGALGIAAGAAALLSHWRSSWTTSSSSS